MHTKRIIPCLDVKDGKVVKGINFKGLINVGDPVELGKYYYEAGADELVFLDVTATHEGRGIMEKVVEKVAENIFIPFTVGGGICSIEDIKRILRAGADKVSLNSAAVKDKQLIKSGSYYFGNQCIVLAVDAKRNTKTFAFVDVTLRFGIGIVAPAIAQTNDCAFHAVGFRLGPIDVTLP